MPPNPSSLPTRAAMYAALMGFRSVWQTRGPGTSNADVWKHDDERGIGLESRVHSATLPPRSVCPPLPSPRRTRGLRV
jgi:hypothetical protein